ncbi:MAG: 4-alpha-glucanotransferase [Clostridia bacterium]
MTDNLRKSGILMHISSLPSDYGIGSLGKSAYNFVDFLNSCGLKLWQILPLVPTGYGDSPYQSCCSYAFNQYFIDLDILENMNLLTKEDILTATNNVEPIDYEFLYHNRFNLLFKAFTRFKPSQEYADFLKVGKYHNYGVFMSIKQHHKGISWDKWGLQYRNRDSVALSQFCLAQSKNIEFWEWTQYIFLQQWFALKSYANNLGVEIIGDMPIYVSYDSLEVWENPQMFLLDKERKPTVVAGCPPDYFSQSGQLWGNPIYDWEYIKQTNYKWWIDRINNALKLFDYVRIDHFRGFANYYAIPYAETTAKCGKWLVGVGFDLFKDLLDKKIIAEDLGQIDDDVKELVKQTNYPNMKVLEFAFDKDPANCHKPTNYNKNCVVYTGTHDNAPLAQFIKELSDKKEFYKQLKLQCEALGVKYSSNGYKNTIQTLINLAYASRSNMVIIPLQDFLCQGKSSRMNLPSTLSCLNWSYRTHKRDFSANLSEYIRNISQKYNR